VAANVIPASRITPTLSGQVLNDFIGSSPRLLSVVTLLVPRTEAADRL
jgi:hypothetical protein